MTKLGTVLKYPASPDEIAARWMARVHAEDCTSAERAELERWLGESPANRTAFAEHQSLWKMPARLSSHADMFGKLAARADAVAKREPAFSWKAALAAGVACIALAIGWMQGQRYEGNEGAATSSLLEQRTIVLDDGSQVTLNGKTTIAPAYSATERRVVMHRGEAFFAVTNDFSRPFVVGIGNSEIRVVGTQFNVRRISGELEVVVREGKVNVIPDLTIAPGESVPRVELVSGSRLRVTTGDSQMSVAPVDAERLTAWRTGMIKFDAVPLEDVIEDVNRYADKPLVIANESLRRLPISGRFRVGDTESVQFMLRERINVEIIRESDRIVLR